MLDYNTTIHFRIFYNTETFRIRFETKVHDETITIRMNVTTGGGLGWGVEAADSKSPPLKYTIN